MADHRADRGMLGAVAMAYRGCRARITELIEPLDTSAGGTPVPSCPGWSVHDVVAHLSGALADVLAGRLEGVGTEEWTEAQVEARRDVALAGLLAELNESAPLVEPLMDEAGEVGHQAVADIASHEHDIRGALGLPGARNSIAVPLALAFAARNVIAAAHDRGLTLRVWATTDMPFGRSEADATLAGEPFELLRAMTGRRSVDQIRAMQWHGDVERAIPAFTWGPIRPAAQSICE